MPTEQEQWVDDQLHSIVGAAQRQIRSFVIAKARKASSGTALAAELRDQGFPASDKTQQFAEQLLARFAQKKQASAAELQHRAAVRARVQNAQLNALSYQDDTAYATLPTTDARAARDPSTQHKRDKSEKSKHKNKDKDKSKDKDKKRKRERRGREEEGGDEEEDAILAKLHKGRSKPQWQIDEEEYDRQETEEQRKKRLEEEAEERARAAEEADLKERSEFEQRLRERDEAERAKRRGGGHVEEDHEALDRGMDDDRKRALVDTLREMSEQVYLEKRSEKKLKEIILELEDEKRMFAGVRLTAKEQEEMRKKEVLLEAAMEIKRVHEAKAEDRYEMPQAYDKNAKGLSDRARLLKARYQDDKPNDEGTPWGEQEELEQEMLKRTGAKAAGGKAAAVGGVPAQGEENEFVFDEIDFVGGLDGIQGDVSSSDDEDEKARKAEEVAAQSARERIKAQREALPAYAYRDEFIKAVFENQVLIIVAETGAGKTTQLPQYLLESGFGKAGMIGCTQPRRVAAMSVAARVAEEMDVRVGREVGYSIRFEDNTSDKTVIKYMTDGMLLREFLNEPTLEGYSVMIIDEAHERTLHTDILFGLVKDIAKVRPEFKLLISSATLDAEKFSEFFGSAQIFKFPGRRYPVDIFYTAQPEADYIEACVVTVLQIHVTQDDGDVLVFLTGQEEIEACEELLKQRTRGFGSKIKDLLICPIYANLPTELQSKIFEPTPPGSRKVVLATNIAETSLTIDGIQYVVDPGFQKINSFSPKTGAESLQVVPTSRASANQRAGRAGRTSAGKCFRLYTQWSFNNDMEDNTAPEIQRTNLTSVALLLKSLGIHNIVEFDFMDPPPTASLLKAFEQLYALGALNSSGDLTKLGRRMAEFPVDPQLAKTILASEKLGCSAEIATVAAMVSVGSAVFYAPKDRKVIADNAKRNFYRGAGGDHTALLLVFQEWAETEYSSQWCHENFIQIRTMKRARDIREQLAGLMERVEIPLESCGEDDAPVRKALTSGYFYHVAQLSKPAESAYKTVKTRSTVYIHPGSGVKEDSEGMLPEYIVYHELVLTSKQYMRTVSATDQAWLREVAPHFFSEADVPDKPKKKIKGKGLAADVSVAR